MVLNGRFLFKQDNLLRGLGINIDFLLQLDELGIITGFESVGGLSIEFRSGEEGRYLNTIVGRKKVLVVMKNDAAASFTLPQYPLTRVGREMMSIGTFDDNLEYLRAISDVVKASGFQVYLGDVSPDRKHALNTQPF